MKKGLLFLVFFALLGFLGWWIWSLGSLPETESIPLTLRVDQGAAEIRRASDVSGAWVSAQSGDTLVAGDRVRTGAGGRARIEFYGKGETRMDERTELEIGASEFNGTSLTFHLRASTGRIWSRILRLLDVDSSVEVETNTVVATVRGTAFDLQLLPTSTVLWVSDSTVQLSRGGIEKPVFVSEGYMASVDANGRLLASQEIGQDAKESDWFRNNTEKDDAFIQSAHERISKAYTSKRQVELGSILDHVVRFSERWHMQMDQEHAAALASRYTARRLFTIRRLVEEGKSGFAFQSLTKLEQDVKTPAGPWVFWKSDRSKTFSEDARRAFQPELQNLVVLFDDVGPSSPLYRLKQRLEDVSVSSNEADAASVIYARLLVIDARLDEASALLMERDKEGAGEMLVAAAQGLGNVERDIDQLGTQTTLARVETLRGKLFALKARESVLRTQLEALRSPPPEALTATPTSTEPVATSTVATPPPTPVVTTPATSTPTITPTPTPVPVVSPVLRIVLSANPNPTLVNDVVVLSVKATRADGTSFDATSKSTFTLLDQLGTLNGPTFTGTGVGRARIRATLLDQAQTFTSEIIVDIQELPKPVPVQQPTAPATTQTPTQTTTTTLFQSPLR